MSSSVDQKLKDLSKTSNNQFIFRVHQTLRKQNEEAYEPEMISIGPYHHGKENLKKMEKYKLKYLQGILKRQGEASAERYVDALRKVEKEARDRYEEDLSLSRDEFVEMMLLDGCFINEFLRKRKGTVDTSADDHIFSLGWCRSILLRDLLLFENQLPFFILELLFDMTKIEDHPDDQLISLSISCFKNCFEANASYEINQPRNKAFHLLRLMHESWLSSFSKPIHTKEKGGCQRIRIEHKKRLCCKGDQQQVQDTQEDRENQNRCIGLKKWLYCGKEQKVKTKDNRVFIKSVCELKEYGVEFQKAKKSSSCLDIKFGDGKMQIPRLTVEDRADSLLRNLIAYEQYINVIAGSSRQVVTDYIYFMDFLINSSKDVQILCDNKIIVNGLGCNEELSNMINRILLEVVFISPENCYEEVFKDVNKYCSRRRNKWIADLKKKYFHNPWVIISFLAAIILLLLTLVQTTFSVLQGGCNLKL